MRNEDGWYIGLRNIGISMACFQEEGKEPEEIERLRIGVEI